MSDEEKEMPLESQKETTDKGLNSMVEASEEIQNAYAEYAVHVITQRALPDVRDGLKPVHRRVLFGMVDESTTADKPHKKSARIVGTIIGKYHPHGDQAVYDAMVRMAQDFSLRCPLVDGHGNFGSIDGDSPAAYRYTEARMSKLADEMVRDINEDTVDWQPNYDESLREPTVLPSRFPNLLVNGSDGIAVGMATKMPPHNLREAIQAVDAVIDNPNITLPALMKFIKGPDFPTGGVILGTEGIKEYFETGHGKLILRAKAHIEDNRGKMSIVVTELPYQLAKNKLIANIADLVKDKTNKANAELSNIIDIRDESDQKTGIRLVIELKKETNPTKVMTLLFKETPLSQTYSVNNLCLVDKVPRTLSLREMIQEYIKFQMEVIVRRSNFRLEKVKARLHILEGYLIALANIDEVVAIIRKSADAATAKASLMKRFKMSDLQAQAVLDLRLQKLTKLDVKDIKAEFDDKTAIKKELEEILKSEDKQKTIIKEDLNLIMAKFADERRTEIIESNGDTVASLEEMLTQVPEEDTLLLLSHEGYIKRVPMVQVKHNSKGTRGNITMELGSKDSVAAIGAAKTTQELWIMAADCNVYMNMVHEVIDQPRAGRGRPIRNLMGESYASVGAILPVFSRDKDNRDLSLLVITDGGMVKRTALEEYTTNRSSILGFQTKPGDRVTGALVVSASDNLVLASSDGLAIHFPVNEIPMQGKKSTGVIGMKLNPGARVIGFGNYPASNPSNYDLLVVTDRGYAKATSLDEYPITKKGGKGVKVGAVDSATQGGVITTCILNNSDLKQLSVLVASAKGNLARLRARDAVRMGRPAKVVKFVVPAPGDSIVSCFSYLD